MTEFVKGRTFYWCRNGSDKLAVADLKRMPQGRHHEFGRLPTKSEVRMAIAKLISVGLCGAATLRWAKAFGLKINRYQNDVFTVEEI